MTAILNLIDIDWPKNLIVLRLKVLSMLKLNPNFLRLVFPFSCFENNALKTEKVKVAKAKYIKFPYLGHQVTVLLVTPKKKDAEEIVVYCPHGDTREINEGDEIKLVKYKNDLFLSSTPS